MTELSRRQFYAKSSTSPSKRDFSGSLYFYVESVSARLGRKSVTVHLRTYLSRSGQSEPLKIEFDIEQRSACAAQNDPEQELHF
jgi:hypothetical protein